MRQMLKLYNPQQRQRAIDAVKSAPDYWIVEIKPQTRSTEQNSMLWRLLTIASQSIPWKVNGLETMLTPEEWKDIFTASLHQENRIARGIRGGMVMLGRSTSIMSTYQFTELIEFIYGFLAEQGVAVDVQEQKVTRDR